MVRRPRGGRFVMTITHGVWPSFVLLLLFPLSFVLYRRFSVPKATMLVVMGATLFGPELAGIKFPLMPAFTKEIIPYFAILLALAVLRPSALRRIRPFSRKPDFLLLVFLIGAYMTAKTNPDPITVGGALTRTLPGMILKDGMFIGVTALFKIGLPFLIGRAFFQTREELRVFYRIFLGFALVMVLPILWEGRMSPQLHNVLYGYRAHPNFLQTIRWGGYRPMVFMQHGLALSLVMGLALMMAISWRQTRERLRVFQRYVKERWLVPGLFAIVFYCKSTAVIAYAVLIAPFLYMGPRMIMRVALAIMAFAITYPWLRTYGWVPTDALVDLFTSMLGGDRAWSMAFRFMNEDAMLAHARERLLWGWGSYSRNLVFSNWLHPSVPDGYWIIILGQSGLAGFVGGFGLLATPIIVAWRRLKRIPSRADRRLVAGLALSLSIGMVDLIPNGLFSNYTYFFAGVLYGVSTYLSSAAGRRRYEEEKAAPRPVPMGPPPGYPPPYPPPGYPPPMGGPPPGYRG